MRNRGELKGIAYGMVAEEFDQAAYEISGSEC
jgi:hypothetical protein